MGNSKFNRSFLASFGLAIVFAMAFCTSVQAQTHEPSPEKKIESGKVGEHCSEMKQQHQKMMEEMKAQDAELAGLVANMNSATQDQKVNLMAEIITRMAKHQSDMHTRMHEMKSNMMERMEAGKYMSDCPMMKKMGAKGAGSKKKGK